MALLEALCVVGMRLCEAESCVDLPVAGNRRQVTEQVRHVAVYSRAGWEGGICVFPGGGGGGGYSPQFRMGVCR